jgi:hypothetical protein
LTGALTAALSYAAHFGCLATQAAAVNDKITKQNNNFLFMIVEFDDKYKPMLVVRSALFIFFSTIIPLYSQAADSYLPQVKSDTLPQKFVMVLGEDTIKIAQDPKELSIWTKEHLIPYWQKGYALARWELHAASRSQEFVPYHFVLDKRITKGKVTGWNDQIMDASLAPLVLNWRRGQLLSSPMQLPNGAEYGIQFQSAQLFFEDSLAQLKVAMRPLNNQYFDGLMGLQQSNGKSVLVGDLKINWTNLFKKGESFFFRWQRQDLATQRLELNMQIPFIFHRPFGWSNAFDFYRKQDLVFQTTLKSQVILHLGNRQKWSSGIELKNNQSLQISNPLFTKHQLWVNTYKTENFILEFALGRRIASNTASDSLTILKQQLYRWEGHWEKEWHKKGWGIHFKLNSLGYYSATLDASEWLRIGGPNSIRGFNTESIFVQQWNGFQSEMGYQLPNIFGYVFMDAGCKNYIALRQLHHAYGLGAKIVRNEMSFSLAYGWGIFPEQSLDLRQGVLHIGFNQRF